MAILRTTADSNAPPTRHLSPLGHFKGGLPDLLVVVATAPHLRRLAADEQLANHVRLVPLLEDLGAVDMLIQRTNCMRRCIVVCMTRLNITMPDELAEQLRAASGGQLSDYISRAVRRQLLDDELRALPDAVHDADWHAEAEQAAEAALFQAAGA